MSEAVPIREKLRAVYLAARYRPRLAIATVGVSLVAAFLEGFGLSFILPIVELAQGGVDPGEATGLLGVFVDSYALLGLPFTLGWLVVGISAVMTVRYTASFLVGWFRGMLETFYIRHLQREAFEHAMAADIAYFDREGSDDILNAIVTQAEYAGRVVRQVIQVVEQSLLALVYALIAVVLAPVLTVGAAAAFVALTYLFRNVLEGGYSIGDRVADANERIQAHAQAGTQGIRDVKLFGLTSELIGQFRAAVDHFTRARIKYFRNRSAIRNYYNLLSAIMVFVLIYAGLVVSELSLGKLAIFLFAMFRLGPMVSSLNERVYSLEGELAHLVRTQGFAADLRGQAEPPAGESPPTPVETVAFDHVRFAYETADDTAVEDLTFAFDRGEFVAFVGHSGAGKSTIAALLARLYEPDDGVITANDTPIDAFDVTEWRSRVAVVRQQPYIFDATLRENLTIGNRDAREDELTAACRIAQVTEFVDDLPNGFDTVLGDDGVRLSGGQRQRVAIARALLKDSDILVLDEATSELDTRLESRIHEAIERLDREYAMLVIAHRLSTVTNADRIYTLDAGRIVDHGTHRELVNRGGEYADLYHRQTH